MEAKKDKNFQKDLLCFIFLGFLVLLHFWNFIIPKDKQFLSGDFIELAGMRELFYQHLQKGGLALWDSLITTGMPYQLADFGVFYPIDLIMGFFSNDYLNPYRLSWQHALHYWLSGIFTYLYARQLGFFRTPALISAISFMLGGFMIGHLGHRNMIQTIIWLPLALYFLDKALMQRRMAWAALSGLVLSFSFLAGHAQIFYYLLLFLLLYYCFRVYLGIKARSFKQVVQDSIYFLTAGFFLLGISAIQLFPSFQGSLISHQAGLPFDWKTQLSFPIANLVHFLIPGYAEWATGALDEHYTYSGMVTLLLSLWAIIRLKDRQSRFFGLVFLFSLLMALGDLTPVYTIFYHILPGLNLFRIPARINVLLVFSLAILAGYGCQLLLNEAITSGLQKGLKSLKALHYIFLSAGIFALILVGSQLPDSGDPLFTHWGFPVKDFLLFMILLSISYLILLGREKYGAKPFIITALVIVVSGDLLISSRIDPKVLRKNPTQGSSKALSIVREIKKDSDLFRIYNEEEIIPSFIRYRQKIYTSDIESAPGFVRRLIPNEYLTLFFLFPKNPYLAELVNTKYFIGKNVKSNFNNGLKLWKFGGKYDDKELELNRPVKISTLAIVSFLSHSTSISQGQEVARVVLEKENGSSSRLSLRAGIETAEWAIDRPGLECLHKKARVSESWEIPNEGYQGHAYLFEKNFSNPKEVSKIGLEYLANQGDLLIKKIFVNGEEIEGLLKERFKLIAPNLYKNTSCLPRAFMIGRAKAISDNNELLEQLEQLDPRETILLSHFPPGYHPPKNSSFSTQEADIRHYSTDKIIISTKAQENKFLVLSDTYNPYWKATIDQKPSPILKVNYGLRGLYVPKGDHQIEFSFHFTPFYYGLAISFISLLGIILFSWWIIRSRFIKH
ncbi:MAG: YfhO family protein [Pseudomonadota bacterium]